MTAIWVRYVLLMEKQGQARETTLQQIEQVYGPTLRQAVESELPTS